MTGYLRENHYSTGGCVRTNRTYVPNRQGSLSRPMAVNSVSVLTKRKFKRQITGIFLKNDLIIELFSILNTITKYFRVFFTYK